VSTLTYFEARPDYGMGRAFVLAFAVHAVLLAVMFIGVRMQNRPGDTVAVELWDLPPPPPEPVVEAPKPPPPKPQPEPEVKKPDIAEKAPPPKPKAEPKKDDEIQRTLIREQIALEQRKLNEERRRIDEERRKAESERTARELAATARSRALAQWTDKIRAKIRGNIVRPQDISGNPEAVFDVALLPTGEILTVRKRRSSGHPGYDEAVERAIYKSSPLPLPDQPGLFRRDLELRFRPFDQ
jgi:colicin import membrane protein